MIAQIMLFKLKKDLGSERLEELMWLSRSTLLKIPEILSMRTGKRINPQDPWHWFVSFEVESLDKLAMCQDDPRYIKFLQEIVRPSVASQQSLSFEMEPRKDVKYS